MKIKGVDFENDKVILTLNKDDVLKMYDKLGYWQDKDYDPELDDYFELFEYLLRVVILYDNEEK